MSGDSWIVSQIRSFFAIAIYTFRNLLREKILYTLFFVAIFLLMIGYLAALLVWGRQDRILLHFGTFVNALAVLAVSLGAGSSVLRTEIENRSIYLLLARPVHRGILLVSKWAGISLFTLAYSTLLMCVVGAGILFLGGPVKGAFFQSFGLVFVESLLASAASIFLSFFLRPGLSAVTCLAYLFLGHNHDQISYLIKKGAAIPGVLVVLRGITPDLSLLLMDTRVFYDQPLASSEFILRAGYGFGWAFMFVLFGNAVFFRKNL